mgnify:CR=1 FL=1
MFSPGQTNMSSSRKVGRPLVQTRPVQQQQQPAQLQQNPYQQLASLQKQTMQFKQQPQQPPQKYQQQPQQPKYQPQQPQQPKYQPQQPKYHQQQNPMQAKRQMYGNNIPLQQQSKPTLSQIQQQFQQKQQQMKLGAASAQSQMSALQPVQQPDFPIDLVYTWVDGDDEELTALRAEYLQKERQENGHYAVHDEAITECRWRDLEELRHSVDSAMKFAPWLRKIFIVTDHQRPYWFDEENPGKLEFVDHPVIFGDMSSEHLPTFNSQAIESHLYQIPDLSEHFIYANNDCLFGAPVQPSDFFTADGKFKVFLTTKLEMEQGVPVANTDPITAVQQNTRAVLFKVFNLPKGFVMNRNKHQMKAMTIQTMEMCWDHPELMPYFFNTSSNRFRSRDDVDVFAVASFVGIFNKLAVRAEINSTYYCITSEDDVKRMFQHMRRSRPGPKLYCINDDMKNASDTVLDMIRRGFERYLFHRPQQRSLQQQSQQQQMSDEVDESQPEKSMSFDFQPRNDSMNARGNMYF